MKPADLRPGHRIAHTVPHMDGTLTVLSEPWGDTDSNWSGVGAVFVTVEASDRSPVWNSDDLPAGTGADRFLFITPTRYSLAYLPDTDIDVENP